MRVRSFAPRQALARFVRAFEIVEADEGTERTLVPETGLVVGFRYAGASSVLEGGSALRVPDRVVTGLRTTARRMYTSPGSGIVLAKLREGGARAFFDEPLHRLFGRSVPLEELVDPREVTAASARVEAAKTDEARVEAMARFLEERAMRRGGGVDAAVVAALRAIHADPGALRVVALARDLGLSVDALEKRFRRAVGASPKQLASVVRLRHAIGSHREGLPLARLAADAGFYDQAHLARSFVAATGTAPTAFFGSVAYCMT